MNVRLELHCHTDYSMDGMMPVDAVMRTAARLGLHAVAVTDHDEIEGAFELQRVVKSTGAELEVVVGEERTLDDGSHLIGLFLKDKLVSTGFCEVVDEIYDQGGVCVVPHPFRKSDGLFRDGVEERLSYFAARPAAFEWHNAKCSWRTNQQAQTELVDCGLAAFGGSDAHYDSDLGQCVMVMDRPKSALLHECVERMCCGVQAYSILGYPQRDGEGERRYAPWYYAVRDYVRLPKSVLPIAKQLYRHYRNTRYGIGSKPLSELYASDQKSH